MQPQPPQHKVLKLLGACQGGKEGLSFFPPEGKAEDEGAEEGESSGNSFPTL